MGMAGSCDASLCCLLLGATGVGKTLLVKRLQNILESRRGRGKRGSWVKGGRSRGVPSEEGKRSEETLLPKEVLSSKDGAKDLGDPPATLPTVGTNLTDLPIGKKITIRELGGCMGPIWSSYYSDCHAVLYMIDAANPTQISASCVQLLSVLSAEQLTSVPVLLIFNKIDLPCYMSLVEMKSLFRIQDIIACAKQVITVVEISARDGRGLSDVMKWFQSTLHD
ncbi:ADP-ribosylation factor-like protein 16 isoform X1 [Pseudonaja textilis]|uniref:ARF like GTPase 16 n=2 Tax=Pseudonaja textilis TaxID=8673 RepID=A0A670Y0F0_PSETE|nr:ADP-ribosylation factor-like protein 16 isoform X1 [Pseudonaja textilis]